MAKINLGKIKNSLRDTAESAASTAKDAAKNIKAPDIKIPEDFSFLKKKDTRIAEEDDNEIKCLSTDSAIQIFFYLMYADGHIEAEEEETLASIAQEFDPDTVSRINDNVEACKKQLDCIEDEEDFFDIVQDGVEKAIYRSVKTRDSFLTPKLLIWDMFSLAFSDGAYDEAECRLIKYVARRLNVDKSIFLELESSMYTLVDLEKELQWIKTTDRPYLTIEAMVNEIADRKNVIYESVKDLISL